MRFQLRETVPEKNVCKDWCTQSEGHKHT
jgi:hypothetical protein